MSKSVFKLVLLPFLLAAGVANAGDLVTDAMQKAYGPYRVVLFKTNSNSQSEAQQAIAQAQRDWNQIAAQFGPQSGKTVPAPYDRDPAFANSLAEVSKPRLPTRSAKTSSVPHTKPWSRRAKSWPRCATAIRWSSTAIT